MALDDALPRALRAPRREPRHGAAARRARHRSAVGASADRRRGGDRSSRSRSARSRSRSRSTRRSTCSAWSPRAARSSPARPSTALGLYVGVFLADWLLLRKAPAASAINGGREALALFGAYGFYAWFAAISDIGRARARITRGRRPGRRAAARGALPVQPRTAVLHAAHPRQAARGRAVAHPPLRDHRVRRRHDRRARVAVHDLERRLDGWLVVAFVLMFAGLLLKRILEEAVAAEELNKIHAMEQVVSSDASLGESLHEIERLANRLVDWNGFRIWRLNNGVAAADLPVGRRAARRAARERRVRWPASRGRAQHRRAARHRRRDPRRARRGRGASAVSLAVVPLRFGDRAIGLVELDHHKRGTYGAEGSHARLAVRESARDGAAHSGSPTAAARGAARASRRSSTR